MEWLICLCIVIVVVGNIILYAIEYWQFSIPIIIAIIGICIYLHYRKKEKRRLEQINAHSKEQQDIYNKIISCGDNALDIYERLSSYLNSAESYMDQAERDFSESAFEPFWVSVEKAVNMLGSFNEDVNNIKRLLDQYNELMKRYESKPPHFTLSFETVYKLKICSSTTKRLEAIVRKAQCNYQFANIFVKRKTNQILVTGFKNLAQALEQMTCQLIESVDNLSTQVTNSTMSLNMRLENISNNNKEHYEQIIEIESNRVVRENKALGMLNDIQSNIQNRK